MNVIHSYTVSTNSNDEVYLSNDTSVVKDLTTLAIPMAKLLGDVMPLTKENLTRMLGASTSAVKSSTNEIARYFDNFTVENGAATFHCAQLAYATLKSLYRWWIGEISGKRCAKMIVDSMISSGAGFVGAAIGLRALEHYGPQCATVGAFVGGLIFTITSSQLVDKLTSKIFDLPKCEALEKAYMFLGVDKNATVETINFAFRNLCLKFNPHMQGGDAEKFQELQCHMTIIKMARGEKYE